MLAARVVGRRYEQLDIRPQAIASYTAYVRRYPKQQDALAIGQRAVCLAHSLGLTDQVKELLNLLEGKFGRAGFARPETAELGALCAGVPPVRSDSSPSSR